MYPSFPKPHISTQADNYFAHQTHCIFALKNNEKQDWQSGIAGRSTVIQSGPTVNTKVAVNHPIINFYKQFLNLFRSTSLKRFSVIKNIYVWFFFGTNRFVTNRRYVARIQSAPKPIWEEKWPIMKSIAACERGRSWRLRTFTTRFRPTKHPALALQHFVGDEAFRFHFSAKTTLHCGGVHVSNIYLRLICESSKYFNTPRLLFMACNSGGLRRKVGGWFFHDDECGELYSPHANESSSSLFM